MAKWRPSGPTADSNHLTFEQLETSFESNGSHENDQHIQHMQRINDSSDRYRDRGAIQRDRQRDAHNQNSYSQVSSHRNRTQHTLHASAHTCNGHQSHQGHASNASHHNHSSHHHYHQCSQPSHCGHSSQCCHTSHIQHNRSNGHLSQCNQEMVTNEELEIHGSHSSHGLSQANYTLDSTEFERIWRQLDSNRDRYHFLQTLYRSSGSLVFSEICFGSLGDIASALCEFDQTVDDFVFVIYILNSLSRAKRFLLSLQFLTVEERIECKKLFIRLWKGMNDIRQDLAENDISELTITALMKVYEIEMDS